MTRNKLNDRKNTKMNRNNPDTNENDQMHYIRIHYKSK